MPIKQLGKSWKLLEEGNRLNIRNRRSRGWDSWKGADVTAYLTMKNVEGISVSGSGDVQGEGKISTGNIDLSVSGSGNMELDLRSDDVDASISGSGKFTWKARETS